MAKFKRILIFCSGHRKIAGVQKYLLQFVDILHEEYFEFHFALPFEDGKDYLDEVIKKRNAYTWNFDWKNENGIRVFFDCVKLIKKVRPDIVIINGYAVNLFRVVWAALFSNIQHRVMIVHWSLLPESFSLVQKKGKLIVPSMWGIRMKLLHYLSFRVLSKLIFVNDITRKKCMQVFSLKSDKCDTVYNGIEIDNDAQQAETRKLLRGELGLSDNELMIFASGNLHVDKGHKFLIKAVPRLLERGLKIKCFIAGEGILYEALRLQIKALKLAEHVVLLGFCDNIKELLTASDIYCMPSLTEGLPYGILEACSFSLPVVASRVGGIPEVVTNGKSGLLFERGNVEALTDCLIALAENPHLRDAYGAEAKKCVKIRFSYDAMFVNTRKALGLADTHSDLYGK